MKALSILIAALALTACGPDANMPMYEQEARPEGMGINTNGRFKVERVGVFKDTLAYDNRRGLYVITDTKTGQEFLGVSGIGISELGSHQSGKSRLSDER